jgi:hypothetical protein
VKPTRQPGEKKKKQASFKKQNCLCMLDGRQIYQNFDLFHLSTKEIKEIVK